MDSNDALSLAEVQSGFPEFSQFDLDTFDLNNSGAIELSETGALLRFATAGSGVPLMANRPTQT